MNRKGQAGPFVLLNVLMLALKIVSVFVIVVLAVGVWNVFNPEKAEASSKKAFEDLVVKMSEIEPGQHRISSGYINDDIWLIGINSEYAPENEEDLQRPQKCGATSNSCICICRDDMCKKVMECKGYPEGKIKDISWNGGDLKIKGAADFTVELTLEGQTLSIDDLNQHQN